MDTQEAPLPDCQRKYCSAFLVALTITFIAASFLLLRPRLESDPAKAGQIMMEGYVERLGVFLLSNQKPDIVVLGSSLVLVPNLLADGYYEQLDIPIENSLAYARFAIDHFPLRHLERLLGEKGISLSSANLGVPACMVGDYNAVFDKLLRFGKRPKILLLALAPRDFLDNTVKPNQSTVFTTLRRYISFNEVVGASHLQKRVCALNSCWQGWALRFHHDLVVSFADLWAHDPKFAAANSTFERKSGSERVKLENDFYVGENTLVNLADYKNRYLPVNGQRFAEQLMELKQLLQKAKQANVHTVVVDMPLTSENKALLDEGTWSAYKTSLQAACQEGGGTLVIPGESIDFAHSDFLDCCHLNARGAHKCLQEICSAIARVY